MIGTEPGYNTLVEDISAICEDWEYIKEVGVSNVIFLLKNVWGGRRVICGSCKLLVLLGNSEVCILAPFTFYSIHLFSSFCLSKL